MFAKFLIIFFSFSLSMAFSVSRAFDETENPTLLPSLFSKSSSSHAPYRSYSLGSIGFFRQNIDGNNLRELEKNGHAFLDGVPFYNALPLLVLREGISSTPLYKSSYASRDQLVSAFLRYNKNLSSPLTPYQKREVINIESAQEFYFSPQLRFFEVKFERSSIGSTSSLLLCSFRPREPFQTQKKEKPEISPLPPKYADPAFLQKIISSLELPAKFVLSLQELEETLREG